MQKSEKYLLKSHRTQPYTNSTLDRARNKHHHSLTTDSPKTLLRSHLENTKNQKRMGSRAIDLITELQSRHVHVKNRDEVDRKLSEIIHQGENKLQIIADFDSTLSAFTLRGVKCVSCHKALDDSPLLPEEYRSKAHALRDHYYAIEVDPNMTVPEKIPYMVKWWNTGHELLIEYKCMTKDKIRRIVQDAKIHLRDACSKMIDNLHQHDVPLLIFSAGLGNIIEEVIIQQSSMHDNMKIVSNMMKFNDQGELVGFENDLIHVFNKNENAIHDSDYFNKLEGRTNVILLGDSLGDLQMAEGANASNLLKIGFLNDRIEDRLESYKDAFDIVLVNDETMDVTNAILQKIWQ